MTLKPRVSLSRNIRLKPISNMPNTQTSKSNSNPAKILKENIKKRAEGKESTTVINPQNSSTNQAEPVNITIKTPTNGAEDNQDTQKNELTLLREQVESWKTKTLRFAADNQNILKQHELDNQQVIKRTKKNVLTLLIPFLTSMNLAFSMMPKSDEQIINKYIDGLKSQLDKLVGDLKNIQVEIIIPINGQSFDPATMAPLNSSEDEEPSVKQLVGLGLRIDGQLIQAATVMI